MKVMFHFQLALSNSLPSLKDFSLSPSFSQNQIAFLRLKRGKIVSQQIENKCHGNLFTVEGLITYQEFEPQKGQQQSSVLLHVALEY